MCKTHFISSFNCSDSPYPFFFPSLLQVNFSYVEAGEQKQALVKLVACKRLVNPLFHDNISLNQFFIGTSVLIMIFVFLKLFLGSLNLAVSIVLSFCSSKCQIGYLA